MKLLIGYDGSAAADAALADLSRAGLPSNLEALLLVAADVWWPPTETPGEAPEARGLGWDMAHRKAREALAEARVLAESAAERLRAAFPGWTVRAEARADAPAWALVKAADSWEPDLLVVGSHGRSGIERLVLGSVSQQVVTAARCSVRVGRRRPGGGAGPVRLLVGVDGSPGADAAVAAIAARTWPVGTEAVAVAVLDPGMRAAAVLRVGGRESDVREAVRGVAEAAAARLSAVGLAASATVGDGDPRRVLVEEAERWGADCVFVGARGLRAIERFLLGSVSAAVAARAPCSVEVVRLRPGRAAAGGG